MHVRTDVYVAATAYCTRQLAVAPIGDGHGRSDRGVQAVGVAARKNQIDRPQLHVRTARQARALGGRGAYVRA